MSTRAYLYLFIIVILSFTLVALKRYEPLPAAIDSRAFLKSSLEKANQLRGSTGLPELSDSERLQKLLREYVDSGQLSAHGLDGIFDHIEAASPLLHEIAANLVYSRHVDHLYDEIAAWPDLQKRDHTHFATVAYPDPNENTLVCLAILARELPRLTLPLLLDPETPIYYDECRLCGKGHGISFAGSTQNTLIVTCPSCNRTYDLIATDTRGQWRRVNQFFTGMTFPELDPSQSAEEQITTIWRGISSRCRYKTDAQRIDGGDSWETPEDTYRLGSGDCEDTSLLLADMLISHGFDARVALGSHDNSGHAWVVVRAEGEEYLLETTWSDIDDLKTPPSLEEIGLEYHPRFLFDKESLYFLKFEGWTGDYWSEKNWLPVSYDEPSGGLAQHSGLPGGQ